MHLKVEFTTFMIKDLVSLIIPTYSRADYILRAINSVLNQTYQPIEIIVVDDNGIGTANQIDTEKKLSCYIRTQKISYIKHEVNKNGSAARNTGIKVSQGEYIVFLDDDDELLPLKIETQVKGLQQNTYYDASYCGFQIIREGKILKRVEPTDSGNFQYELLACRWSIGTGSNPMFRRSVFEEIGLFDESFIRHQDVEIMVRFFREHKMLAVKDILINRYIDSRINTIDYRKLYQVKKKFLYTFKNDIEKYSKKKQNTIYRNQYADVACHAMMNKKYKDAFVLYKKASSYKCLSLRVIAKAILYGFFNWEVE